MSNKKALKVIKEYELLYSKNILISSKLYYEYTIAINLINKRQTVY